MSGKGLEKETANSTTELYDIKIEPLPPDTRTDFLWQAKNPGKGVVGFENLEGEYRQFQYELIEGEPRYKLLAEIADKFPSHILPMLDTHLARKVIAKSGTRTGGGTFNRRDPSGEAHMAGLAEHPNIASVHGIAADKNRQPYIIMEYLPNGMLEQWLEKDHRIEEVDSVVKGIASALDYIHTKSKIVYADMKPYNVGFDEEWRPKIFDFELAMKMDDDGLVHSARGGTPEYEAPEQVVHNEPLSVRTDVYSLTATVFSILVAQQGSSGIGSFRVENFEKIPQSLIPFRKAYEKQLSKVQKKQLSAVLHKALSKEPNDRYASIKEFYQRWHQALTAS